MRKIYFFFLLLCTQLFFAQFTENDIKFWVGTGSKKAYFIADFNDNNTPRSYAWGYRFDGDNLMVEDMINAIMAAEPKIEADIPSGFLYSFKYNHHTPSTDDYWITWTGSNAENLSNQNNGVGYTALTDGLWFGITYGLDFSDTPPSTPVPAYSSEWYTSSQITNWMGTGNNKSLVVVDFGTHNSNNNANSFVFGIKYNGSITAEQALQLIQSQASYFNFTSSNNQISNLSLNTFSGNNSGTESWKLYTGKDLSSWQKKADLSQIQLSNNTWLGLSFGDRSPFTPTEASNTTLSVASVNKKASFHIFPNPTSDFIQIDTPENIKEVNIYSSLGQKVMTSQTTKINVKSLNAGIYWVEIKTKNGATVHKVVKK
ncbi:T9SS type A sorting domain-containing protein [Chryseobacterium jejuense]|uniref:Por secretion system C-terminal sorting domain n=1 Tax=Chryseobacterium jejuense TaxID=445960 RepID=A0A2X2X8Q1_CHRJE|nr:T9SS type A sorting domain-containing protein [Chryseobacterium jejuense]SDI16247.1 Por secretion system C-terminal sorting domain-containing protein [Chryseobacterium jejuense]SQB46543.1 Por secretion system C-terminal sorting domain [Chryseobacterium jejuense]